MRHPNHFKTALSYWPRGLMKYITTNYINLSTKVAQMTNVRYGYNPKDNTGLVLNEETRWKKYFINKIQFWKKYLQLMRMTRWQNRMRFQVLESWTTHKYLKHTKRFPCLEFPLASFKILRSQNNKLRKLEVYLNTMEEQTCKSGQNST